MSLPLGHMAAGLAVNEVCPGGSSALRQWRSLLCIAILANLPDMDILAGLLVQGNGNLYHRGPTHSLLFALLAGALAANLWRLAPAWIPRFRFLAAFLIVSSHLAADFLFTTGPLSFFWPLEVTFSSGCLSLAEVVHSVIFQAFQDAGLILFCGLTVALHRFMRSGFGQLRWREPVLQRIKRRDRR